MNILEKIKKDIKKNLKVLSIDTNKIILGFDKREITNKSSGRFNIPKRPFLKK